MRCSDVECHAHQLAAHPCVVQGYGYDEGRFEAERNAQAIIDLLNRR
jgi:hypothetical protein